MAGKERLCDLASEKETETEKERGEEKGKTASELVDEMDAMEREALENIHQNWGDESVCTYSSGYISQPVYSCLTCREELGEGGEERGGEVGVCFGCSLRCHLDHNVIELFEKRNFRCDCGVRTPIDCSFASSPRSPTSTSLNRYNANFLNKYCWCGRPYDTSTETLAKGSDSVTPSGNSSVTSSTENVMRQCYFCQDWFHEDCIEERAKEWWRRRERGGERGRGKERERVEHVAIDGDVCGSYVCVECAKRGKFLTDAYGLMVNPLVWLTEEEEEVAVCEECPLTLTDTHTDHKQNPSTCTRYFTPSLPISTSSLSQVWACDVCETQYRSNEAIRFHCLDCDDFDICFLCHTRSTHTHPPTHKFEISEFGAKRLCDAGLHHSVGLFLCHGWRTLICRCTSCTAMYHRLGWMYLVSDEKDEGTELPAALQPSSSSSSASSTTSSSSSSSAVNLFEIPPPSSSSSSSVSLVQSAMDAFMSSDIDHTKKLMFVERYQHMESSLKEYLKKLKESGVTTVTAEHIREFEYELTKENPAKRRKMN